MTAAPVPHDIGKIYHNFQVYLLSDEDQKGGPDPKSAGTLFPLQQKRELLAFLLAWHHGGLQSAMDLKAWLGEKSKLAASIAQNYTIIESAFPAGVRPWRGGR